MNNSRHEEKQLRHSLGVAGQTVPTEDICEKMDICRAAFIGPRPDPVALNQSRHMGVHTLSAETAELRRRLAKLYPELMRVQQLDG